MHEGENDNKLVELEIIKLKSVVSGGERQKTNEKSFEWPDLKLKTVQKALTIGLVMVILNQFSGVVAMLTYTASIFQEAGSNIHPNISSIIVAFIQLVSTVFASFAVDRAGRKVNNFTESLQS